MDIIIKNAKIINADTEFYADIGIENETICAIGQNLEDSRAEVIDASGLYAMPGGVEVHAHFSSPFFSAVSSDDYKSGTCAAICGGVTTVVDFATQEKGKPLMQAVEAHRKMGDGNTYTDYSFHVIVTDLSKDTEDEIEDVIEYGIPSFKLYTVYKKEGLMMNDGDICRLLEKTKKCKGLVSVHAENPDVIDVRTSQYLAAGQTSSWYHYMSRPEFVEAEAEKRVIHWAKALDAPIYIVHVACKEGIEAVAEAKAKGYKIFAETCPHYLNFTNDVYKRPDAAKFVCSPPIKGSQSREALWDAIKKGYVDTIASDHCPFMWSEKLWGKDDFTKTPNGCGGIETRYVYMLSNANEGKITFKNVVRMCAQRPAEIFGCSKKGKIEVGCDADLILFDPKGSMIYTKENMKSKADHSIWEGPEFSGKITKTVLRGKVICENGELKQQTPQGRFIKRDRFKL